MSLQVEYVRCRGEDKVYVIAIGDDMSKTTKFGSAAKQSRLFARQGLMALGSIRNPRRNMELKNRLEAFRLKHEDEFLAFASAQIHRDGAMFQAIEEHITELMSSKQKIEDDRRASERYRNRKEEPEVQDDNIKPLRSVLGEAVDRQIRAALSLDFDTMPRQSRSGDGSQIDVHNRKQSKQYERFMAVALAKMWGHENPNLTFNKRHEIADAACRQIAYDHGFRASSGSHILRRWQDELSNGLVSGARNPLKTNHHVPVALTVKVERAHPGYLHFLYRYGTSTLGAKATIEEITSIMNEKSHAPGELRPGLNLHYKQVYRWWKANGGTEKSAIEKLRLTEVHKGDRVIWVDRWEPHFLREEFPVAYLDEKWFYPATRRNLLKCLPCGPTEPKGADIIIRPRARSCRFPIKVMYLGVVARPRTFTTGVFNGRSFNGRIMLERISKTEAVKSKTKHSRFSRDANINYEIKCGGWKKCTALV